MVNNKNICYITLVIFVYSNRGEGGLRYKFDGQWQILHQIYSGHPHVVQGEMAMTGC